MNEFCHKLKSSNPHIFETFDSIIFDYFIQHNSYFEIYKVYNIPKDIGKPSLWQILNSINLKTPHFCFQLAAKYLIIYN